MNLPRTVLFVSNDSTSAKSKSTTTIKVLVRLSLPFLGGLSESTPVMNSLLSTQIISIVLLQSSQMHTTRKVSSLTEMHHLLRLRPPMSSSMTIGSPPLPHHSPSIFSSNACLRFLGVALLCCYTNCLWHAIIFSFE